MWISAVWSLAAVDHSAGGVEINGFLAFLLWMVAVFAMIKTKPIIPAIVSTIVVIVVSSVKYGININWDGLEEPIGTMLLLIILWKWFSGALDNMENESNAREQRKRDANSKGEACCPWCGSTSIQYYALGIPYEHYDEIYRKREKHVCLHCGREW